MVDSGATSWLMISTGLVLLMVVGLAMFYGGLVRSKNVLGTIMHSLVAASVIGVLWVICGYSLAFGKNILFGFWGWDPRYILLKGIDNSVVDKIPEYIFAMFQGQFAIITPALISGAIAERVYFRGYILFLLLWVLFVYCPVCHWVWAKDGWLANAGANGVIDLAGGLVVHASAGMSALVLAILLGARKGYPNTPMSPNNLVMTMIGAGLLWVGWFGFNAGSALQSGIASARALTVTHIAAASGALTWIIIEAFVYKKATSLGFASGVLAGLVAITPAAGVVGPVGALVLGAISSFACYIALNAKGRFGYDDSLDCFGIHGVGSMMGIIFLVFFIRDSWIKHAASLAGGRWTIWNLLFIQLEGLGITILLAVIFTIAIYFAVEKTVGFRMDEQDEIEGMDQALHGESAYGFLHEVF